MQSFDTKDSNTLESFDTFSTKDSELEQSGNDFVASFDRKFQSFDRKDSEFQQSDNEFVDRKFEISGEETLPDSESFGTKDSEMKQSGIRVAEGFDQ